nr:serine/threonine-protein kinase meng-po-like [Cherax quadricarinatus]
MILEKMPEAERKESFKSVKMVELTTLELEQQFAEVRLLKETNNVKVFGARCLQPLFTSVALKCVQKNATKKKDFHREFHYNYNLGLHPNIISCRAEAFETNSSYMFTQELAPEGDLSKFIKKGGLREQHAKSVTKQVTSALEVIHKRDLVHGDVCTENIFVFDRELSLVKLGDFSKTQQEGALVKKLKVGSPWAPPEVSVAVYNEGYHVHSSQDAWQLGILIFVCLTGSYPWSSADITDHHYNSWVAWLKRKTTKTPRRFRCFTPRLLRLLRRLLHPKLVNRTGVREVVKYLSEPWLLTNVSSNVTIDSSSSEFLGASKISLFSRSESKVVEIISSYLHRYRSMKR